MENHSTHVSLRSLGLKETKLRTDLLKYLDHPVDAIELTDKFQVNKTTIYRELKTLIKNGLIIEVDFGDGKKRYELSSLGHHHHLICLECNSVTDITVADDLVEVEKKIAEEKMFKVQRHNLEFFGLCASCQGI